MDTRLALLAEILVDTRQDLGSVLAQMGWVLPCKQNNLVSPAGEWDNYPFTHLLWQVYQHVRNKNGVPHCRSRYFVFKWRRKVAVKNGKASRRTPKQSRWTPKMIEDLLNCLYTVGYTHTDLRCTSKKCKVFNEPLNNSHIFNFLVVSTQI